MSIADLVAFRGVLVADLQRVMEDPRLAESISDLVVAVQRRELGGQTIPRRETGRRQRVLELLRQRVPAALIARRLGIHRSSVYRIRQSLAA